MTPTLTTFFIGWIASFVLIQLGLWISRAFIRHRNAHNAAIIAAFHAAHGQDPNLFTQYYPPKRTGHPLTSVFKDPPKNS